MLWDIVGLLVVIAVVRVAWSMRDKVEPVRPLSAPQRASLVALGFVEISADHWRLSEPTRSVSFSLASGDSSAVGLSIRSMRLPDDTFAYELIHLEARAWPVGGPERLTPRRADFLKPNLVPGLDVEARVMVEHKGNREARQVPPAGLVLVKRLLSDLPDVAALPGLEVEFEVHGSTDFSLDLHWNESPLENRIDLALQLLRQLIARLPEPAPSA